MRFDFGFGAAFVLFILITSASTAAIKIFAPAECPEPVETTVN